jgi:putative ABC transport system ATP-binding protein
LNIIGSIDRSTSGEIIVYGQDLNASEEVLADFRCNNVGFVFQSYNLISTLTASENIAFPMEWTRKPEEHIRSRVEELLNLVDLGDRAGHFPSQLSGGEQQRVAFARALANEPPLLLVDEPTGNLDVETGLKIVEILKKLKSDGKTVIAATHDDRIIQLGDKRLLLKDGELVEQNE